MIYVLMSKVSINYFVKINTQPFESDSFYILNQLF